jgi:hypothetical protein
MQVIEDTIYVTYALVDTMTGEAARGTGNGVVTAYDLDGNFLARIGTDGLLDAPWGITVADEEFGEFGGALLVGNFGNGRITAFDAMTYEVLGQLESAENTPISIEGLWAIAFGNDMNAGDADDLYFTAGIEDEQGGLFGEIGVEEDPAEDDHGDDDDDDDGDDDDDDGKDDDGDDGKDDDGDDHDDDGKDDDGDDGKDDHGDDGKDDDDHDSDGDDHDDDDDHDKD